MTLHSGRRCWFFLIWQKNEVSWEELKSIYKIPLVNNIILLWYLYITLIYRLYMYVAKYNLGTARLNGRSSRDLQGYWVLLHCMCCAASWSLWIICTVFSTSLRILAPSLPSPLVVGLQVSIGQVSCFHWFIQCDGAHYSLILGVVSTSRVAMDNLPFGLWFLLTANLSGTSSQAHQFVMSLKGSLTLPKRKLKMFSAHIKMKSWTVFSNPSYSQIVNFRKTDYFRDELVWMVLYAFACDL